MQKLFRGVAIAIVLGLCRSAAATTITVTSAADTGAGSLRQALLDSHDGDTITFSIPGSPSVIVLTSGELAVDKNIWISGPGANVLAVGRDQNASNFRIFYVTPGRTVTVQGIAIRNGDGNDRGGGVYNDHSILTLDDCTISDNVASTGGGIYSDGSSGSAMLTMNNCTMSGNQAGSGGAIYNGATAGGSASLAINSSTLSDNGSGSFGGGILNVSSKAGVASLTISNTTLSDNHTGGTGGNGGGIANSAEGSGNSTVTIANSTLSGNSGQGYGNSIFNVQGSGGNVTVHIGNTILNTRVSSIGNIYNVGTVISHGYNLSSDAGVLGGTGTLNAPGDRINTEPMLGPLKDNGGPTFTHTPLVDSPAIDAGKRDTISALTTDVDQRGFQRPVDDPVVPNTGGGDSSDIGAVETTLGVHPMNAVSRKTHGSSGNFDLDLPLNGPTGIECRSGGVSNNYQISVTFANNVAFTGAAMTSGTGNVTSASGSGGTQALINLTGVRNAQRVVVALFGVNDGTNISDVGVPINLLVADTNGTGIVNASDVSQAKAHLGEAISGANFRIDVTANGTINASDVSLVKSKLGTALP